MDQHPQPTIQPPTQPTAQPTTLPAAQLQSSQPPLWLDARPPMPVAAGPTGASNFDGPVDPKFPGIGISVVWIVAYFALQIVLSIPAVLIAGFLDPDLRDKLGSGEFGQTREALLDASAVPVLAALVLAGVITTGLMWLHLRKHNRHRVIGLFSRSALSTGKTFGYSIGLMVAALLLGGLYSSLVLKGRDAQEDTKAIVDALDSPGAYLLGMFAIVVVAPIVEELLFRGYLQTALRRYLHPYVAIGLSAAIFAAIHLQPLAFPVLALLGAVFGYLYHLTGSLKVCILLHLANNAIAFSALVASTSGGA